MSHRQNDAKDSLAMLAWFPRDWRASDSRAELTSLQRGLYRELMDAAWLDGTCSLPNDDKKLAAAAGCQLKVWMRVKGEILACFTIGDDGRLRQPRLTHTWEHGVVGRAARRKAAEETNAKRAAERAAAEAKRDADRDADRDGKRDGDRTPAPASAPAPASNERKGGSTPAPAGDLPPAPRECRHPALKTAAPGRTPVCSDCGQEFPASLAKYGAPGEAEQLRREIYAELTATSAATKLPADVLQAKYSRTPGGQVITNLENCTSVAWLRVLRDQLRGARLSATADAHQAQQPTPKDERRRASMSAGISGGLKGDGTLGGER